VCGRRLAIQLPAMAACLSRIYDDSPICATAGHSKLDLSSDREIPAKRKFRESRLSFPLVAPPLVLWGANRSPALLRFISSPPKEMGRDISMRIHPPSLSLARFERACHAVVRNDIAQARSRKSRKCRGRNVPASPRAVSAGATASS